MADLEFWEGRFWVCHSKAVILYSWVIKGWDGFPYVCCLLWFELPCCLLDLACGLMCCACLAETWFGADLRWSLRSDLIKCHHKADLGAKHLAVWHTPPKRAINLIMPTLFYSIDSFLETYLRIEINSWFILLDILLPYNFSKKIIILLMWKV